MANKKPKQTHERIDFKKVVWVIDNLTKDHMTVYDKNPPTDEEIVDAINNLCEEGASVSIKFDHYSGKGVLSTATFSLTGYTNTGYAISARGVDAKDSLGILCFKYFTVAQRDLSLWDYGKDEGFKRG